MNKKLPMGINALAIDTDTPLSGGVYFAVMEYEGKLFMKKHILLIILIVTILTLYSREFVFLQELEHGAGLYGKINYKCI